MERCPICQEETRHSGPLVRTPCCGHRFHRNCVYQLFDSAMTFRVPCPLCRRNIEDPREVNRNRDFFHQFWNEMWDYGILLLKFVLLLPIWLLGKLVYFIYQCCHSCGYCEVDIEEAEALIFHHDFYESLEAVVITPRSFRNEYNRRF